MTEAPEVIRCRNCCYWHSDTDNEGVCMEELGPMVTLDSLTIEVRTEGEFFCAHFDNDIGDWEPQNEED